MPHKILLVEDDSQIVENLSKFLNENGFDVKAAGGQVQAINAIKTEAFDLFLIDISLPDGSGYAVCSAVKEHLKDAPVIFITALDDEYSVVTGLDMGADDYITKPFRPRELLSRIKNILRRAGKASTTIHIGNVSIDTLKGAVIKNGSEVFLSALEYRLLLIFINNRGITLSRNSILQEIWDVSGEFVNDNTLTVYIKRLRDKIEDDPQNPSIIKTVRGMGYRMD